MINDALKINLTLILTLCWTLFIVWGIFITYRTLFINIYGHSISAKVVLRFGCSSFNLYCYSDNLIPGLPNTAHRCSRHGLVAASLTSAQSGHVVPVPKTSTLFGVGVHCLSSLQHSTTLLIMSVFAMNYFVKNVWHSSWLQCLNDAAECFALWDNIFDTERKSLKLHEMCFPSEQLASSPLCYQGSSYLTRTVSSPVHITIALFSKHSSIQSVSLYYGHWNMNQ
jgi:hypothetical protein